MYGDLDAAIASGDLARALGEALGAWREARRPGLADLIDTLSSRIGGVVPPQHDRHAAWLARAQVYDPLAVGPLVATGAQRMTWELPFADVAARHAGDATFDAYASAGGAHGRGHALIDRFLTVARWPDDPRLTWLLLRWLEDMPQTNLPEHAVVYGALAEHLAQLADVRAAPRLRWLVAQAPRLYKPHHPRTLLAEQLVAQLPEAAPDDDIAPLAVALARAPRHGLDALWEQAARDQPDARSVLADALTELGDPRGEVIALQLAGTQGTEARARKLIKQHWDDWLGDVARVINTASRYRRGFLELIEVGHSFTPPWAYAAVAGHRELAAVDTARASTIATPDGFAALLAGLAHDVRRVELPNDGFVHGLARARPRWETLELRLERKPGRSTSPPPLADAIATIAAMMPGLIVLELGAMTHFEAGETLPLLAGLPAQFPRLACIRVHRHIAWSDNARALPLVELLDD